MKFKYMMVLGVAAGVVVAGAAFSDAYADRREHKGKHSWHSGYDREIERRHHRRQRAQSGFYGPGSFKSGCHRYKAQAHRSGDPYWWGMYNRCKRIGR